MLSCCPRRRSYVGAQRPRTKVPHKSAVPRVVTEHARTARYRQLYDHVREFVRALNACGCSVLFVRDNDVGVCECEVRHP